MTRTSLRSPNVILTIVNFLPFLFSLYPTIVDSSNHCGYACTFNILTSDSSTSFYQSLVHPDSHDDYAFFASMCGGEKTIHNVINNDDNNHNHHPMIKFQYDFAIRDESIPSNTSNNWEFTEAQI